jgi:hypothetical protein
MSPSAHPLQQMLTPTISLPLRSGPVSPIHISLSFTARRLPKRWASSSKIAQRRARAFGTSSGPGAGEERVC